MTIDEHRLEGLEPDNLLAFLALLGLLRTLEEARPAWRPRIRWSLNEPPLRPVLRLREPAGPDMICAAAAEGLSSLAATVAAIEWNDLKQSRTITRECLKNSRGFPRSSVVPNLLSALVSDQAIDLETDVTRPVALAYPSVATSNFLQNLKATAGSAMPLIVGRSRDPTFPQSPSVVIEQAIFQVWTRSDRPVGLRLDHQEAKRHAYQALAPTATAPTTQHGANRLAIIGISCLRGAPVSNHTLVDVSICGGSGFGDGFAFSWPIWGECLSLEAIVCFLGQISAEGAISFRAESELRVMRSARISVDRLRAFAPARAQ